MTNDEAIALVRELGHIFSVALTEVTGQSIEDKSDVMNGLAAYEILELKGKWDKVDKAVQVVLGLRPAGTL